MSTQIQGLLLSPQQARMWMLQHDGSVYAAQCTVLITGDLDTAQLRAALQAVVDQHEILRTTFYRPAGIKLPIQAIQNQGAVRWQQSQLIGLSQQEQAQAIRRHGEAARSQPFDLQHGPVLSAQLLTLGPQQHALLLTLPSLCADTQSLKNLMQALSAAYAHQTEEQPAVDDVVQYADFSEWQNQLLDSEEALAGKQYWQTQDRSRYAPVRLPLETIKPEAAAFKPVAVTLPIDLDTRNGLDALAQTYGSSLEQVLLACWQILIWRYTNQDHIVVGVVCDGRKFDELESSLGLFSRSVPVHTHMTPQLSLQDLLAQLHESMLAAYEWQEFFTLEADSAGDPDAQEVTSSFEFTEGPVSSTVGAVTFTIAEHMAYTDRFVVGLQGSRSPEGLDLVLHADSNRISAEALAVLAEAFTALLTHIATAPTSSLARLNLLSPRSFERLVVQLNQTSAPLPDTTLPECFSTQVLRTPDAPAVHWRDQILSFAQLDAQANQLAHVLQARGIGSEDLVGLALDRTPLLLVAVLGVLKAGASYLPLDASMPAARTAMILEQAAVRLILSETARQDDLPAQAAPVVLLDKLASELTSPATSVPPCRIFPEQLAYVLFTSGSTGQPKGVAVTHAGLLNYLTWAIATYLGDEGQGAPVHSPLSFDLTVTSLLVPLLAGQAVTLLDEEQPLEALAQALTPNADFSLVKLTPAHLALLDKELARGALAGSTRALVIGGEALRSELLRRWQREAPATRLINEYGPTETVVGCCIYEVRGDQPSAEVVPIGRPIANTQVYVLDAALQPVPVGVTGELYVGGLGVARGYLGESARTAERFVPNPFSEQPGARLYRTGDLVRYSLDNDNLEFLGRNDQQVKIRSYRLELGEIEAVLQQHPAVHDTVVTTTPGTNNDPQLVAYVTTNAEVVVDANDLHQFLAERLPWYMIPSDFLELDQLPLTANGKVDRRALPQPGQLRPMLKAAYCPPQTPVEHMLAEIFAEVLGQERVGIHDSFFSLGGDSIMSVRVVALAKERQIHFSVRQLFQHQTIATLTQQLALASDLAARSETGQQIDEEAEWKQILEHLEALSDEDAQQQLHERMQLSHERSA